jgi:23S rRNA pseudouridine1911/1915/1917 synthase
LELSRIYKKRDAKPGNVFLGLVHRIDRPTSGLVIYAKTSKALSRLTQMVKNREVKKPIGQLWKRNDSTKSKTGSLFKKNEKNNKAIVFPKATEGAKEAILTYNVIKTLDNYLFLKLILKPEDIIRSELNCLKQEFRLKEI